MCRDRRGSLDAVTACRGCVSANFCPGCAALVQPGAKIQLLDLRAAPLAPKADTLARRFPVYWVQPRRFLRVGARPTLQACRGLTGGDVPDQSGNWAFGFKSTSSRWFLPRVALRDSCPKRQR